MGERLAQEMLGPPWAQVWNQLYFQLDDHLRGQLWLQLRDQLHYQMEDQLWLQLQDQMEDQLQGETTDG